MRRPGAERIFTALGADGYVNAVARELVELRFGRLSATWKVAPHFTFKPRHDVALDIASNGLAGGPDVVVEAKQHPGHLTGDEQGWERAGRSSCSPLERSCPGCDHRCESQRLARFGQGQAGRHDQRGSRGVGKVGC